MNEAATHIDFFIPEILTDPEPFYEGMRSTRPVFETRLSGFDSNVFVVTSYDLVKTVLGDAERFPSEFAELMMQGAEPNPEADALFEDGIKQGSILLSMDDPAHKRYRALASTAFTPRQTALLADKMTAAIDELIDAVIERGECDFIADIAVPYPIRMICDMLGYDRSMHAKMQRWSDAFILRISQQQTKEEDLQAVRDIIEFQTFNKQAIADRRAAPRDDLISHLAHARVDGLEPLTDREAVVHIQEIGVAGNETSRNTLIGGFAMLLEDPALMARIKADPSLIPAVVEEMLRLISPVSGMWRIAKCDTYLGDMPIPAGAILNARIESANRDPAVFEEPGRLDPERRNRSAHLTFGFGSHYCIGNMLARRELTIAIGRLIERLHNPRIDAALSDLSRIPSVIVRAPKALHIKFDPGIRLASIDG